jgi:hypothetical protein
VSEAGPQVAQVVVCIQRRAGAPRQRQQRRAQARQQVPAQRVQLGVLPRRPAAGSARPARALRNQGARGDRAPRQHGPANRCVRVYTILTPARAALQRAPGTVWHLVDGVQGCKGAHQQLRLGGRRLPAWLPPCDRVHATLTLAYTALRRALWTAGHLIDGVQRGEGALQQLRLGRGRLPAWRRGGARGRLIRRRGARRRARRRLPRGAVRKPGEAPRCHHRPARQAHAAWGGRQKRGAEPGPARPAGARALVASHRRWSCRRHVTARTARLGARGAARNTAPGRTGRCDSAAACGRPQPPPALIRRNAPAALQPITAFTNSGPARLADAAGMPGRGPERPGRRAAGRSLPGAHWCCGDRSSASQAAPGAESTLPPGVAARPPSASPPPDDSALGRRSSGPRAGGAPGAAAQAASTPANAAHSAAASPLAAPVPAARTLWAAAVQAPSLSRARTAPQASPACATSRASSEATGSAEPQVAPARMHATAALASQSAIAIRDPQLPSLGHQLRSSPHRLMAALRRDRAAGSPHILHCHAQRLAACPHRASLRARPQAAAMPRRLWHSQVHFQSLSPPLSQERSKCAEHPTTCCTLQGRSHQCVLAPRVSQFAAATWARCCAEPGAPGQAR